MPELNFKRLTLLVKYENVLKSILKLYKMKLFYNVIIRNLFFKFIKNLEKLHLNLQKNIITNVRF